MTKSYSSTLEPGIFNSVGIAPSATTRISEFFQVKKIKLRNRRAGMMNNKYDCSSETLENITISDISTSRKIQLRDFTILMQWRKITYNYTAYNYRIVKFHNTSYHVNYSDAYTIIASYYNSSQF